MIKMIVARVGKEDKSDKFDDYLGPSMKNFTNIPMLEIFNSDNDSMFAKYNRGIKSFDVQDDDIIVFCHADVKILDPNFDKKLEIIFKKKKNVGLVGMIGTTQFPLAGGWWLCDHSLHRGHLIQGMPGSDGKKTFHMNRKTGYFEDLVSVDGFCFAVRGKVAKEIPFDETTYPNSYHFYDCDMSLSVLEKGWDIAVADILLEHSSEGPLPSSWHQNKLKFIKKWQDKGYVFPINKGQFK